MVRSLKKTKELNAQDDSARSITFTVMDEQDRPIEMLKINSDGFFVQGEKVEDIEVVYKRFSEWLAKTEALALEMEDRERKRQDILDNSLKDILNKYPKDDEGLYNDVVIG